MTKNADFKRLVRVRMTKIGELYTTARSRLIASGSAAVFDTVPASGALLIDALH